MCLAGRELSHHHNDITRDLRGSTSLIFLIDRYQNKGVIRIVKIGVFTISSTQDQYITSQTVHKMAALNPTGPSQPSQDTAYNTSGNPATKAPAEQATSQQQAKDDAPQVFVPSTRPMTTINTNPPTATKESQTSRQAPWMKQHRRPWLGVSAALDLAKTPTT